MQMQAITQEYFTIITLAIVLNASIGTTILKYIYDPSKRYINYKRRTIQHSRHETELKILVCIHEEDDVFGLMNILKACYPTKKTPIVTYALDLMELVGRITPIFINHQFHKHQSPTATTNRTDRIISAFQQFETQSEGIKRYNFTAVAPYSSMHDEICTLALDRGVSLLIIPFKKSETIPMRGVKRNVLDKAPCSVGILVNKRIVLSRNAHSSGYNVCVVFLGGPDSRESLAFAMRTLENPATKVTVIRLIAEDDFVSDLLEMKLDTRVITEVTSLFGDEGRRVQYKEVMVKDGAQTIEVLRDIDNEFDIMLVGRRVDADSLLVSGLMDWSYEHELGIIGDVLASTDMKSTAPVLVIQQQSTVEDLLVKRTVDNSMIILSISGSTTSTGSSGKAKKLKVSCQLQNKISCFNSQFWLHDTKVVDALSAKAWETCRDVFGPQARALQLSASGTALDMLLAEKTENLPSVLETISQGTHG